MELPAFCDGNATVLLRSESVMANTNYP